jgi:dipeptidyl aminopeptidase/acylaminoacyl peptidase
MQATRLFSGAGRILCLLAFLIASCNSPQVSGNRISVEIVADGSSESIVLLEGSTVGEALDQMDIEIGALDRVTPPSYTVLSDGAIITLQRIDERFEIEEIIIPFERQIIRNEALPEGESRILQPGENGVREITYRIVTEDGQDVSQTAVRSEIIVPSVPEIIMVGSQSAYTPLTIQGTLAYLASGNAWIIEGDTGNRRPIIVTGDLDGRVFKLSPDGRWLLFTRSGNQEEDEINSLWVVSTINSNAQPFDLGGRNIVHFADWVPGDGLSVLYSTAEPSPAAPGWQANNDLIRVDFDPAGILEEPEVVLESNAGGQYGWWGTAFIWGPDSILAYARSDGIGEVDLNQGQLIEWVGITPYQTMGDWAWVPGLAFSSDGDIIYFVWHDQPVGLESPPASPAFSLSALPIEEGQLINLIERAGMFAYPSTSPPIRLTNGEDYQRVAYLQAITPLESDRSNYRLMIMDRDGSNPITLFPPDGEPGISPDTQSIAWSPDSERVAVRYRGDVWIIDISSGITHQLTSDGQVQTLDWSP